MKIIVISDTHGNQKFLRKALKNENTFNYVFHLGDNFDDIDFNEDVIGGAEVLRVPGIFHPGYLDRSIPATQTISINKTSFLLIHNINDLNKIDSDVKVVFYGHTHKPAIESSGGVHFANPGHLKQDHHRGSDASYLVVSIEGKEITFCFKNLNGSTWRKERIIIDHE